MQTAFWNANGLLKQKLELEVFVTCHDLDVVVVKETHLRDGDVAKMANYNVFRYDRRYRRGGGRTILVKSIIIHNVCNLNERVNLKATAV